MDDDNGDTHDYDAKLYVGGLEVASVGDRVPAELLAVFTDEMYRTHTATEAAHPPRIEPGDILHELASPGLIIGDRLNILGFTPIHVLQTIDRMLDEARDLADLVHQFMRDEAMPVNDAARVRLAGLTAAEWIAELGACALAVLQWIVTGLETPTGSCHSSKMLTGGRRCGRPCWHAPKRSPS